jgi:hypothetical protein
VNQDLDQCAVSQVVSSVCEVDRVKPVACLQSYTEGHSATGKIYVNEKFQ